MTGGAGDISASCRVTELFRSIQGESSFVGRPCTFVRLTGCNLRCAWCDTPYAYEGGEDMSIVSIVEAVRALGADVVEVTGGEPLSQPGALPLLRALADVADTLLLETNGSLPLDGVPSTAHIIMDLKTPSSGMASRNLPAAAAALGPKDEVKFVVADLADMAWTITMVRNLRLLDHCGAVLVSPTQGRCEAKDLAAWILASGLPLRLNLQLHKLLWPGEDRRR